MLILSFFAGILLALQLAEVPNAFWLYSLVPGALIYYKWPITRLPLAFIGGFLWVVIHAQINFNNAFDVSLAKKPVLVEGVVSSLPEKNKRNVRFNLQVQKLSLNGEVKAHPKQIRLSWYGAYENIQPGETWRLLVSLKPPSGMLNPGAFDYERWLLEQGIQATGYVKKSEKNQRLLATAGISANRLRYALKSRLESTLPEGELRGVILALLIGDRSQIEESQWQVLTATGTNHLVAISGLHIGLVAGAAFFIFRFLFRRSRKFLLYLPAHKAAAFAALCAAFFYAMLAGFAIPTQRALIMTAVVMLGMLINRRFAYTKILSAALLLVILLDPFSVLSTGFWLSFLAVGAILYTMQSRISPKGLWWHWGRVQWVVFLALIPVLLFAFQTFSVISPIANFIAVPWVSFLVVPFVLLAGVLSFMPMVSDGLFWLAHESLLILWKLLTFFAELPLAQWQQFTPVSWTLLPAMLGILLILAPRGFPGRYLAIIFLLPLFLIKPPAPKEGEAWFTLLDVGQGLSAVVRTKNHTLVFDTGPRFSETFDTGEAVVAPFLRQAAVQEIDTLIISHGDNDHIGGMHSLLQQFEVNQLLTSVKHKINHKQTEQCLSGQSWHWDGIDFRLLHPSEVSDRQSENNASCVLQVSNKQSAILLTGDIEKAAEKFLIKQWQTDLQSQILVAPHHGSNTSSTQAFIEMVKPQLVLFPAGYLNRFGFPKTKVLERYYPTGAKLMSTGDAGAISIRLQQTGFSQPQAYRMTERRFWHRPFLSLEQKTIN